MICTVCFRCQNFTFS